MPVTWRLNRPCHCTVPRQASAAGDGKSCQRSQTRRWPARQDCQCPAVRPVPECPPLPAEDRRQCRHSQSFRKMAACHPAGVPACRSPAVQQYRSPPGKHGRSFASGHVLVRFSQHPGSVKLYLLLRYRKACCAHLTPERAKKTRA